MCGYLFFLFIIFLVCSFDLPTKSLSILFLIWIIQLQVRFESLNQKFNQLLEEFDENKALLKSLKHKIKNSAVSSDTNDSQKATESSEVQETISTKQTQQNIDETNKEPGINKALSILKEKKDINHNDSLSSIESSNVNAETNSESTTKPASSIEKEIPQNNYKEASETQDSSPKLQEPQTPKEPISFVQIFSWVGGFILLLGIIFWIKYALENNLISPDTRIALGTIAGITLWIAGALLKKPEVKTTSDTLCACGLCTCYSAWFAAYYFYNIAPASLTFILLSLVALASFATAVWKNAQYIGVLAQAIGFVTPFLFPTNSEQIWFLLAYAGIINVTAVAAALFRNWPNQLYTGLVFTFMSFIGIINTSEPIQLTLFASIFILLYTAVAARKNNKTLMYCSFVFTFIGLFVLAFRTHSLKIDSLPYIIAFTSLFSICFGILSSWKKNNELCFATLGFAFSAFVLIAFTGSFKALLAFIAFIMLFFGILTAIMKQPYLQIGAIVLSTLGSIVLFTELGMTNTNTEYLSYYAGFAVFFTVFFGIIAFIQKNSTLLINTIAFSFITFTLLLPYKDNQNYVIPIAAVFTLFFSILSYKLHNKTSQYVSVGFTSLSAILLSIASLLHTNLSMNLVLAYTLSATVLYYFIAAKEKNGTIFTLSSASMAIPMVLFTAETIFTKTSNEMLYWSFGWSTVITTAIYILRNKFEKNKSAWISSIIWNIFAAFLINIKSSFLQEATKISAGSVAIAISVIYAYLVYTFVKSCNLADDNDKFKLSSLICAPITFITLAITMHSTNEWETMAFALEGLALIVLWHYLKVNILQNIGLGLMSIVTIRLLFNPYVEEYHEETMLIFNWYLFTYTLCAIILFVGSRFWRQEEKDTVPTIMRAVSGIIIFALINIEIANYFAKGKGLSFNFCGGLAEAAAYTIAWALYGAICMFNSSSKNSWLLKVGIGLISLSLLKLFLADIWNLSSGLRIIVLIGVAVILLAISFIYQQFKKQKSVS